MLKPKTRKRRKLEDPLPLPQYWGKSLVDCKLLAKTVRLVKLPSIPCFVPAGERSKKSTPADAEEKSKSKGTHAKMYQSRSQDMTLSASYADWHISSMIKPFRPDSWPTKFDPTFWANLQWFEPLPLWRRVSRVSSSKDSRQPPSRKIQTESTDLHGYNINNSHPVRAALPLLTRGRHLEKPTVPPLCLATAKFTFRLPNPETALQQLPPELKLKVAEYLSFKDIVSLKYTNRDFHKLLHTDLWPFPSGKQGLERVYLNPAPQDTRRSGIKRIDGMSFLVAVLFSLERLDTYKSRNLLACGCCLRFRHEDAFPLIDRYDSRKLRDGVSAIARICAQCCDHSTQHLHSVRWQASADWNECSRDLETGKPHACLEHGRMLNCVKCEKVRPLEDSRARPCCFCSLREVEVKEWLATKGATATETDKAVNPKNELNRIWRLVKGVSMATEE